ncbi:hypothetical protein EV182_003162 [Spiromyces aspiralis]|uniref:Uncharacterized protein n=1 Tax=Spiromyces aspiralis TaxID=68401 RepID=A0ACC1HQR1_9FUNG|nr:hypothetical protein EV182_003162 [Spiromyces aspiralis]
MSDYLNTSVTTNNRAGAGAGASASKGHAEFNPPKFAVQHDIPFATTYARVMHGLGKFFGAIGKVPVLFCFPNPYKEVEQGEVGLVTRYGQFYKAVDPGLVDINPVSEKLVCVNVRVQITPIGSIPVVTKDNVNIRMESVLYWHITDPYLATFGVADVRTALMERTQTTLRAVAGSRVLQDLIENRESVAAAITELIDQPARDWGVTVESILVKDIHLSTELQQSLSAAAIQKRVGESKVIAAKAEVDAAKLMREAAEILDSPAAMQIRYLETLQAMSKNAGTKILFVPMAENAPQSLAHKTPIVPVDADGSKLLTADRKGKGVGDGVKDAVLFNQLSEM